MSKQKNMLGALGSLILLCFLTMGFYYSWIIGMKLLIWGFFRSNATYFICCAIYLPSIFFYCYYTIDLVKDIVVYASKVIKDG